MRLNEEAPGTDGRVIDFIARFRLGQLNKETNHFGRGVELTTLLACAVGKKLDQVFI